MNKTELVAAMAEKAELSKKDAEKALKAFTDVVADELKKGLLKNRPFSFLVNLKRLLSLLKLYQL